MSIETPQSIHCNTGEATQAYKQIDKFFLSISNKIEPKPLNHPIYFEQRVYNLCKFQDNPSDDKLHALVYKDRIIAAVTETRTEFNDINFTFFQNLEGILNNKQG